VTQAELGRYLRLTRALRLGGKQHARLRQRLLLAHAAGAAVEAGPLALEVRRQYQRRLAVDRVAAALGEPALEALLQRVGLTEVDLVAVIEVGQAARSAAAGKAPRGSLAPAEFPWLGLG
jgi:hypothetical protein